MATDASVVEDSSELINPFAFLEDVDDVAPGSADSDFALTSDTLYIDIETIPDYSRAELFKLPPLPVALRRLALDQCPAKESVIAGTIEQIKERLPTLLSDGTGFPPEFLRAVISSEQAAAKPRKMVIDLFRGMLTACEQEQSMIQAAADAQRKQMALCPEMCRIVALGWASGGGDTHSVICERDDDSERSLLEQFWSLAASHRRIVGYNLARFDLPVLFVRSLLLGVPCSRRIDLNPFKGDVIDLMVARFSRDKPMGLKRLARLMGVDVPAGDVDGSQVESLSPEQLKTYVESDVSVTRALHRLYSGAFCA